MHLRKFGYVRVSSRDQNEDRQIIEMEKLNIRSENIYTDKQSGKDFNRPRYLLMLNKLCAGDILFVKSIDRLGRNYEDILNQWKLLTREKNIDIVVIDMPLLDTRKGKDLMGTFIADLVLQVLSFVAQNERENIRQRQREGICAAKKRGVEFGRPVKKVPEDFMQMIEKWKKGQISANDIAMQSNISIATFYRRLREINIKK